MKISDLFRLAFLNLYRRLSRSLLTVTGVVIGTACIVVMIAIGTTNLNEFNEMFENIDLNKIEVMEGMASESGIGRQELNDTVVEAFARIENVESIVPVKRITMHGEAEKYHADYLNVMAVPREAVSAMAELEEGRYFSESSNMPELVMGLGAAQYFMQSEDDYKRDYEGPSLDWMNIGIELYLGNAYQKDNPEIPSSRKYRANVVGIIKDENENYHNMDVYMSLETAKAILQENYKLANKINLDANTYDYVYVYTESVDDIVGILEILREYGFDADSDIKHIEEMKKQQRSQQGQLAAIGFISLLVSAIGIANTMMTSILERKKEIGVMKVIGVAIGKIRLIYLIESALIGLMGGILGVVLGHLLAYLMSTGTDTTMLLGMRFGSGVKACYPDMAGPGRRWRCCGGRHDGRCVSRKASDKDERY